MTFAGRSVCSEQLKGLPLTSKWSKSEFHFPRNSPIWVSIVLTPPPPKPPPAYTAFFLRCYEPHVQTARQEVWTHSCGNRLSPDRWWQQPSCSFSAPPQSYLFKECYYVVSQNRQFIFRKSQNSNEILGYH